MGDKNQLKNMKKVLLFVLLSCSLTQVYCASSADTIYLRTRVKQVIVVQEVYPTQIRYLELGGEKKDIRSLSINEVSQIMYANGTKDVFNPFYPQPQPLIQWLTEATETDKEELTINACIQHNPQTVRVEVNGVVSSINVRGFKAVTSTDCTDGLPITHSVRLREGQNQIVLIAVNASGTTRSKPLIFQFQKNPKRIALVIGNSAYSASNRLPNPINDSKALAQKLRSLGFEVIERQDTKQGDLRNVVAQFGSSIQSQKYEVALFFFAGHGIQVGGRNYLIPIDITPQSESELKVLAVSADDILDQMNTEGNTERTNLMILDACRDNPLARNWTRSTGGKGLASMSAPAGTLIAFSTRPGQTALDGDGKNSPYTSELLKALDEPLMRLEDIFKMVRVKVMQVTNSQQIPMENSLLTRELILNKSRKK